MLALRAATRFELTGSGRLAAENAPDRPSPPRMWLAGSAAGNLLRLRVDVPDETARAVERLAASEPPLGGQTDVPIHLQRYLERLGAEGAVVRDVTYLVTPPLAYATDARIVSSDTDEGALLLARLGAGSMPAGLAAMGFEDATHLWPPWCVVIAEGEIVSVAFTARLSAVGAEVGVATPPPFRGRGFAAAATAAWAASPALAGRVRLYSAALTNVSSQRVAARLGLPLLGPALSIR